MTLSCFDRALRFADDTIMPDVWYNIGQIAIAIGDMAQAYQSFKVALSIDSNHAECHCNLGVLELRKGAIDKVSFGKEKDFLFLRLFFPSCALWLFLAF